MSTTKDWNCSACGRTKFLLGEVLVKVVVTFEHHQLWSRKKRGRKRRKKKKEEKKEEKINLFDEAVDNLS